MRRKAALAGLFAVAATSAVWWLAHPTPLATCLAPAVAADELSHAINKQLAELGQRAVLIGEDKSVPLAGRQFFACRRGGAWVTALANPDWPREAFDTLQMSPSFEYGRQLQKVKAESPSLTPEAADAAARLLAQASPVADAIKQARQCGGTSSRSDTETLETAAVPFVAAVAMGSGLATKEDAMATAATLLTVLTERGSEVRCDSPRLMKQAVLLKTFSDGKLSGLPCRVTKDEAGPVLTCQ